MFSLSLWQLINHNLFMIFVKFRNHTFFRQYWILVFCQSHLTLSRTSDYGLEKTFCIGWEINWHRSRVNFVKREALLIHMNPWHFISKPIQKVNLDIFMLKRPMTPKKSKKSMSIFRHVTSGIHWKRFATDFLRFIPGEWHRNVNINVWIPKRAFWSMSLISAGFTDRNVLWFI